MRAMLVAPGAHLRACERMPDPRAYVLAGGHGRRLGGDKPMAILAGEPLVLHVVRACRAAGLEPVAVTKRWSRLPEGLLRVDEPDEPVHPLAGIAAALAHADGAPAVVVAADLPFVPPALLRTLAGHPHPGAVVAEAAGRLQPLTARYPARAAPALLAAARSGARATDAVLALDPVRVPAAPHELADVDTPGQLACSEHIIRRSSQRA